MFSILGELVVMRFTSIGDTRSYQSGSTPDFLVEHVTEDVTGAFTRLGNFETSTFLTDWIGAKFNALFFGNPILINVGFQSITFIGLLYLLLSLPPRPRFSLALFLMLPSFSLWTSIASKECIVSFCVSVISGYLIRQYTLGTRLNLFHALTFLLLYNFKPHYLIAIAYAWCANVIGSAVIQKELLAFLGLLISLIGLFLFRDQIDDLSFRVQWSFETITDIRSTRLEAFFVDKYDVFSKFPEGMFRAFVGPTMEEAATSPLHLATFVESMVLIGALIFAIAKRYRDIPVYSFIVGIGVSFWILFPNYPFGVMNAGSAIRYRSGWIVLLLVAITVLTSRDLYEFWIQRRTKKMR
jgi:hypothetical protein